MRPFAGPQPAQIDAPICLLVKLGKAPALHPHEPLERSLVIRVPTRQGRTVFDEIVRVIEYCEASHAAGIKALIERGARPYQGSV